MQEALSILIDKLNNPELLGKRVIPWSCPVPSFGNVSEAKIATMGLNPSNREFVDEDGKELAGPDRRFHTLNSLGLRHWSEVRGQQLRMIEELCATYFFRNPYNRWFKDLDELISGTYCSYYDSSSVACHLDLIPYATACKWTELTSQERTSLLNLSAGNLGLLLKDAPVRLLVLNGKAVVDNLEKLTGREFQVVLMPSWTLPRRSGRGVSGYGYIGSLNEVGGVGLKQEIFVLGYNHNIQSSFGVTTKVKLSIREWITEMAERLNW